jgi:hypothetical protein
MEKRKCLYCHQTTPTRGCKGCGWWYKMNLERCRHDRPECECQNPRILEKRNEKPMNNWWNEVHESEGWFVEELIDEAEDYYLDTDHGKIEGYEARNYSKGCPTCGTLTGVHGFSFDKKPASGIG